MVEFVERVDGIDFIPLLGSDELNDIKDTVFGIAPDLARRHTATGKLQSRLPSYLVDRPGMVDYYNQVRDHNRVLDAHFSWLFDRLLAVMAECLRRRHDCCRGSRDPDFSFSFPASIPTASV